MATAVWLNHSLTHTWVFCIGIDEQPWRPETTAAMKPAAVVKTKCWRTHLRNWLSKTKIDCHRLSSWLNLRRRIPNSTQLIIVALPHFRWRHDGHVVSGYVWQKRSPSGDVKTGKTTSRCWTSFFKLRVAWCRHDVMAWFVPRAGSGRWDVECSHTLLTLNLLAPTTVGARINP